MSSADTPVSAAEFAQWMAAFAPFENNPVLAVAVSGGADSMTLTLLAHQWTLSYGGRVIGITIDHALRTESSEEAQQVGEWLAAHSIEHHTLTLTTLTPGQPHLQEAAREARYRALCNFCHDHAILHLLLGHHQDDQAETFIMRLNRSSGLDGLAGMAVLSRREGIQLLRPLLAIPKSRLIATLEAMNQPWIEDPSNNSTTYTRNRIRQALQRLEKADVSSAQLAQATLSLGRARETMENLTASGLARYVSIFPEGYARVKNILFEQETDLALRSLAALITTIGGNTAHPRLDHLERALQTIRAQDFQRLTLGGCFVTQSQKKNEKGQLLISREPDAIEPPLPVIPGETTFWDHRFQIRMQSREKEAHYTVGALGQQDVKQLISRFPWLESAPLPKMVLATLPAIRRLEELLLVPHIQAAGNVGKMVKAAARFTPAKPLAGPAFCWLNDTIYRGEEHCA